MAEPASTETPEAPRSRFGQLLTQIEDQHAADGVEPITEDEAMNLAVAEVREARTERVQRASRRVRRNR
jgi:hypothetical protein